MDDELIDWEGMMRGKRGSLDPFLLNAAMQTFRARIAGLAVPIFVSLWLRPCANEDKGG